MSKVNLNTDKPLSEPCAQRLRLLLKFYVTKLKKLETNNLTLEDLIQKSKSSTEKGIGLEEKLQDRDEDAYRLQQSLSDAQLTLYEEREAFLQVRSDHEKLKLERDDFRRKFQTALLLGGKTEREVTYFLERHPKAPELTDEMIKLKQQIRTCSGEKLDEFGSLDSGFLRKEVYRLENSLADMHAMHEDKMVSMKKSQVLAKTEAANRITQLQNRLAASTEQIREKTELLHRSLVQNVDLQRKLLIAEDQLVCFPKSARPQTTGPLLNVASTVTVTKEDPMSGTVKRLERNVARLEGEVMDKENVILELKMGSIRIEKQMNRLREETQETKKVAEVEIRRLLERNQLLRKRQEDLDLRRKLDGAGFRVEIQELTKFLRVIRRALDKTVERTRQPRKVGSGVTTQSGQVSGKVTTTTLPVNKHRQSGNRGVNERQLKKILEVANHKVHLLDELIQKTMIKSQYT